MAVNINFGTTDPAKVGGAPRVAPGLAHFMVLDVQEYGGKNNDQHVIKCEVMAHTDPKEVGKTHTEYFPTSDEMAWKVLAFCYATGLAQKDDLVNRKASGASGAAIELTQAVGQQFFGEIQASESKKDGKVYHNLNNMLSVFDPAAAHHPRRSELLPPGVPVAGANGPAAPPRVIPANQVQAIPAAPQAQAAGNPFASVANVLSNS